MNYRRMRYGPNS